MEPKPKVQLVGKDGNVFMIIGQCKKALRAAKVPEEQSNEIIRKMMHAHSYDKVLQIVMEEFDVE